MNYDLEERTAKFGEDVIEFVGKINRSEINRPLVNQIVRSATSVGANYMEANEASSKKDFRNKIHIYKKEIKETKYWLQLMAKTNPEIKEKIRILWKEAQELTLIFSKITATMSKSKINKN